MKRTYLFELILAELILIRQSVRKEDLSIAEGGVKLASTTESEIPKYMDVHMIIALLRISRTTFYNVVRNRLLFPVVRIGRRDLYSAEEVYDLIRRRENKYYQIGTMQPVEENRDAA